MDMMGYGSYTMNFNTPSAKMLQHQFPQQLPEPYYQMAA